MAVPVAWPFAPDWSDGITERLSWLTGIHVSRTGAEQREALRIAPRRQIDFPVGFTDMERSYFEVLLARQGGTPWHVPIPHEVIPLGLFTAAGEDTFALDTAYREISVGTKMLIRGLDGLHTEIIEVTAIASDHIVTSPTDLAYGYATMTPTFLGIIVEKPEFARRTARISTGTVRFVSVAPMVWPATTRALAGFSTSFRPTLGAASYPVLTQQPNAVKDLSYTFERMYSTVDNAQSIPVYVDTGLRQITSQQYEWFLVGRQEQQEFRDRLFYLQGRYKPLWVPTFNDDLPIGQGYPNPLDFPTTSLPGREYFAQFLADGSVGCFAAPAYSTGDGIPTAGFDDLSVRQRSFISLKRLDSDDIEFLHHTAAEGVATASASFRDAPDLRVPAAFTPMAFSNSGYWVTVDTHTPATNVSTGLTDTLTIIGAAGGGA